ncbi:MAG: molybdopterin-dependent oxidoreductase [Vicinamibacterales bacterium]
MDRRTFIKLTAITGTSAGIAACGVPEHQIIRFVPDEELVPGVAEWKPSVCPLCSSGCGLNVRVMMADVDVTKDGQTGVVRKGVAKKLEGFETHPVNRGGLCARGQAAIQITYHPDRIAQPLKRRGARGSGDFEVITWEQAVGEVVGKLDALAGADNAKALSIILGGRRSHRRLLFEQFAARFGAPAPIVYELFSDDLLRRANLLSFGVAQLPTYDLGEALFVIGFGADFLGTWNSPVAHAEAFGRMRRGRVAARGSFVQVEARMTPTGASADEWVAAKPGTDGVVALGIAHVLMRDKLRTATTGRAGALIDGWTAGLPDYAPDRVAALTGVSARRLERIAHDIAERSPALAIVGDVPLAHTNGLFTALAVNALNELLGAVGQKGGLLFTPQMAHAAPASRPSLAQFASGVVPQLLIVDEANPVFSAPASLKVRDAVEKVPFIVSFASFVDETSVLADLILPDSTFLESWIDAMPESGSSQAVVSVAAPVMKPLFDSRPTGDVMLEVAGKLQTPINLGATSYDAFVRGALAPLGDDASIPHRNRADGGATCRRGSLRRRPLPNRSRRRCDSRSRRSPATPVRPVPVPAVRVGRVLRRVARAPAVDAGAARSDDFRDVEQLGRVRIRRRRSGSASRSAMSWTWRRRAGRCARRPSSIRRCRPTSWRCRSVRGTRTTRDTPADADRTRSPSSRR